MLKPTPMKADKPAIYFNMFEIFEAQGIYEEIMIEEAFLERINSQQKGVKKSIDRNFLSQEWI